MAVSLTHSFTSAITDSADASLVQPSHWNAEHQLTCATNVILGRVTATTGAVEELTPTQAKGLLAIAVADVSGLQAALDAKVDDSQISAFGATLIDDADASAARTTLAAAGSGAATSSGLTMATARILGRKTASTGAIEELTLTETLDLVGSAAQGDILYRGASNWSKLAAGTSGQILRTNGTGANPDWATVSAGGSAGIYEIAPSKPVLADFTLENAGTASAADGTFGIVLTMPSSTVNVRFLRYNAGLPGSTWDVKLRASMITPYSTPNIHHSAILLRNSGTGRIVTFAQNGGSILSQNWSSYTAFASGVFSFGAVYGPQGLWKRITCDGTNLVFYTSVNGTDWGQVGAVTLAAYISSVDQIGVGSLNGAASGVTNVNVFESFTLV